LAPRRVFKISAASPASPASPAWMAVFPGVFGGFRCGGCRGVFRALLVALRTLVRSHLLDPPRRDAVVPGIPRGIPRTQRPPAGDLVLQLPEAVAERAGVRQAVALGPVAERLAEVGVSLRVRLDDLEQSADADAPLRDRLRYPRQPAQHGGQHAEVAL